VIEKHAAQLCVLAEDCNQPDYVKLVKALCADHGVGLLMVPSVKTLGEWAGVSSFLLAFLYESLMFLVYI
jgi:small subunit ribosomal protein S12e